MFKLLALTLFCTFAIGETFWFIPKLEFGLSTYGQTSSESESSEEITLFPSPSKEKTPYPSLPPSEEGTRYSPPPKKDINAGCETWPNQTISTMPEKIITNSEDDLMKRSLVNIYIYRKKFTASMIGTIIAPNWVLTQAYRLCSQDNKTLLETIENVNVRSDLFTSNEKNYTVVDIVCHPNYTRNDIIALVRVKERLIDSNNHAKIAPYSLLSGEALVGYEGRSIGFVEIDENGKKIRSSEQFLTSYIQTRDECNKKKSVTMFSYPKQQQFCTEVRTENMCETQNGSPLIVGGFIVGIICSVITFGHCEPSIIEVWTDVTYYFPWIKKSMCSYERKYKEQ